MSFIPVIERESKANLLIYYMPQLQKIYFAWMARFLHA